MVDNDITFIYPSTDKFIIIETTTRQHQFNMTEAMVMNILSFKTCLNCHTDKHLNQLVSQVNPSDWNSKTYQFFLTTQLYKPVEQSNWKIMESSPSLYCVEQDLAQNFRFCNDSPLGATSATDLTNRIITHVWWVIMNNFSYSVDQTEYVWVHIILILIASLLFKTVLVDQSKYKSLAVILQDLIDFTKMLVEQGGTFLEGNNSNAGRISVGQYLLGAIVISNAYRNGNFCNMVQQRAPIPYEKFQQMIDDDFEIFTRNVGTLDFQEFPDEGGFESMVSYDPHFSLFWDTVEQNIISEVEVLKRFLFVETYKVLNSNVAKD